MILEIAAVTLIVGQYIYHRLTDDKPGHAPGVITVPQTEDGAAIPMFWGRCRITKPIVPWYGNATATQRSGYDDGVFYYEVDVLFVLGIPFYDGLTYLQQIYVADKLMQPLQPDMELTSDLTATSVLYLDNSGAGGADVEGPQFTAMNFEFGDGASTQDMASSQTHGAMVLSGIDATKIPSFRGYATLLAYNLGRNDTSMPAIGAEVWSYPISTALPSSPGTQTDDPNPVDVLYDIHTSPFGKLGLSSTRIDLPSWLTAAEKLYAERHGYSRCVDSRVPAREIVMDILRQVDGAIDEDPDTGKLRLKLIRADFDPADLLVINPDNCERLESFAASGWNRIVNKVTVLWTNPDDDYREATAIAHNMAFAGPNGETESVELRYPGCCSVTTAGEIASRELTSMSRPLQRFRAIVSRAFWRSMVGDAIAVNWPEYNISGRIFRVARVSRGTADSNIMALDLIEDFFYLHRWQVNDSGGLPSHPEEPIE